MLKTQTQSSLLSLGTVYSLFVLSGFSALIYQVVWQRSLFKLYGVNIESVTVVVTAFMMGLGLGSLVGGILSTKTGNRLIFLFGFIELLIGLYGLVSLQLFSLVGQFTAGVSPLMTFFLSFLLVLLPTALMGATLPILVAHVVKVSRNVGKSVGTLYFVNTLGSALAAMVSAIWLFGLLGQHHMIEFASAINISIGIAVLARSVYIIKVGNIR